MKNKEQVMDAIPFITAGFVVLFSIGESPFMMMTMMLMAVSLCVFGFIRIALRKKHDR